MAGVGFELKKLFRRRAGYLNTLKAYATTAAVTEGPLVLGIVMLLTTRLLLRLWHASYSDQEIYLITTTYIMVFSLIVSNVFLMLVSRFISDCIYEERKERILPSFFSVTAYLLVIGGVIAFVYLLLIDVPLLHKLLNFLEFEVMLVVWTQMAYLSAIKKYLRVLTGFLVAALVAIAGSALLMAGGVEPLTAAFVGSTAGYVLMMVIYLQELVSFYPRGPMSLAVLFPYFQKYGSLVACGFLSAFALFGHNFVYWFSPYRTEVIENMVYCMKYDVAAFWASLTIIPFLVIFVVALEVNFYKAYRTYFDTILYGGTLQDIRNENRNLGRTLFRELAHAFELQFFVELLCIVFLGDFLSYWTFDLEMLSIFQYLCMGYCFYVLVKSLTILLLYFDDRTGAVMVMGLFAGLSVLFSVAVMFFGIEWYGMGFLAAGVVSSVVGLVYLRRFLDRLEYHVFCRQPLFYEEPQGIFIKLAELINEQDRRVSLVHQYRDGTGHRRKRGSNGTGGQRGLDRDADAHVDDGQEPPCEARGADGEPNDR